MPHAPTAFRIFSRSRSRLKRRFISDFPHDDEKVPAPRRLFFIIFFIPYNIKPAVNQQPTQFFAAERRIIKLFPEHLSPHDLVELLRGFRTRRPAVHADAQDSGEDPTGLDTGAASAKHSSGRSSALTTKLNLYGANDKTKTVTVDPDVITPASSENPATAATLRQVTLLAYNPDSKKLQPTKAYVLATEPVNDGAEVDVGGGGTLPEKEFLIKTEAAKLQITAGSGSGSSATPPKLKLILPIYNPATPERTDTLTLEADASALKGKDGDPGEPGKDGTFDPGTALSLEVVTGVTYDTSTHKLQMTKRTIQFYGVRAGTQKTVDITTATAHSAEHEG